MPSFRRASHSIQGNPEESYADETAENDIVALNGQSANTRAPESSANDAAPAIPRPRSDDENSAAWQLRPAGSPPLLAKNSIARGRLFDNLEYRKWAVTTYSMYHCGPTFMAFKFQERFGIPAGFTKARIETACRSLIYESKKFGKEVAECKTTFDAATQAPFALPGPRLQALSDLVERNLAAGDDKTALKGFVVIQRELGIGPGRSGVHVNVHQHSGDDGMVTISIGALLGMTADELVRLNPGDGSPQAAQKMIRLARRAQLRLSEGAQADDIIDVDPDEVIDPANIMLPRPPRAEDDDEPNDEEA
jgi:hypothetical protein